MIHILEADGIQLEFNGRRILSDIYLKCETGKITGLLGRNGEGKSCLMQIIYGSLESENSVRCDGVVYRKAFRQHGLLLYLPQFNFIPKSLTLKRIFQDFDLEFSLFEKRFPEFKNRYTSPLSSFSGGECRLVELYIIIKSRSQFALLDEPFTHATPILADKIVELILEEKKNKGFLITDHMFKWVTEISDYLYLLKNGKTHLAQGLADVELLGYARL